jgi:hypothetical protein
LHCGQSRIFGASGELVKAKMDPKTNPLIKAAGADFETTQGRSIAPDGLHAAQSWGCG